VHFSTLLNRPAVPTFSLPDSSPYAPREDAENPGIGNDIGVPTSVHNVDGRRCPKTFDPPCSGFPDDSQRFIRSTTESGYPREWRQ
jgi:hypothetical protein